MSFPTTPRINSPMLGDFYGKTVRIIGKVESQDGDIIKLEANGPVKVKADDSNYEVGNFYEIVGKVEGSDQIVCLTSTDFGTNISEYERGGGGTGDTLATRITTN